MVDATTVNILLTIPANGADSGAWDVPVNANMTELDGKLGGVVSVALTNVNVTLTKPTGTVTAGAGPSQAANAVIKFTGTLTGNVVITFPMPGYYIVKNTCTGSFYVQLSGGAGNKIGAPPGQACHIYSDGTDCEYVSLAHPGAYWDYGGSSVPLWISACTVAPYLACDGTAVSRATYATLFGILSTSYGSGNGSTTFNLPDLRNRNRYGLNDFGAGASNRITSAGSGLDGTSLGAAGGEETHTLTTAELAAHSHVVTDPGHTHSVISSYTLGGGGTGKSLQAGGAHTDSGLLTTATTGISISNAGSGTAHNNIAPALIAGITLIKT